MTIDTLLGLFGAATGLIGLFLAYYFYRKSIRTKVLAIAYTDPIPLMMTLGNLEVAYHGSSISALSRTYILFWNRGTAPIEASDFLSPIKVKASAPILKLEIHDKDAAASVTLDEHTRDLSISLLRPGEAITNPGMPNTLVAELVSEGYRPDVSVEMKSSDMSTVTSGFHYLYPSLSGFFTFVIVYSAELMILFSLKNVIGRSNHHPLNFFPSSKPRNSFFFMGATIGLTLIGIILLSIIPMLVGVAVQEGHKYHARTNDDTSCVEIFGVQSLGMGNTGAVKEIQKIHRR